MTEEKDISQNPTSCSLVIINRCCLQCKMCYMWKAGRNEGEVTVEEAKTFISRVADILDGPREFIISGGEPLLKEGLEDIIYHATQCGLKTVMPTNGYLLTEEKARALAEAGLREIFISLDSHNPKTHDFLRGKQGCFEQVMRAVDYLYRYAATGIRINYLSVLSAINLDEMIDHVHRMAGDRRISGMYIQAIAAPFFIEVNDDWRMQSEHSMLWPQDSKKVCTVIDEIIRLKMEKHFIIHNHAKQLELYKRYFSAPLMRARKGGCYMGDYVINVDQEGNIHLCCFEKPVGNIRTHDIRTLWTSEEVKRRKQMMHECMRNCHNIVNCFFKEDEAMV